MAPPKLAGYAPVADIFHPAKVHFGEPLRDEADISRFCRGDSLFSQGFHFYEPLAGKHWLNNRVAAVTVAYTMGQVFSFQKVTARLQVAHNFFAAVIAVQPLVTRARFRAHLALFINYYDLLQTMPVPHLKVVGIVGRGDFNRPCAEGRVHILVGDERHLPPDQGQNKHFSNQSGIALVIRVHRHGRVTKHRFRPGGRDNNMPFPVFKRIFQIPKMPGFFYMLHFDIGYGGVTFGTPVGNVVIAVNQTALEKLDKDFPHSIRATFIHGKPFPLPVARGAQSS
ncbi:MAG: hypothetical protein A4E52_01055 [Pelotomaculum sp. PtaB.Bin013]|nr:MAG: hypothetical protein A4E52_01055 [Pelotomaculum sp. PtaB.Bin013]